MTTHSASYQIVHGNGAPVAISPNNTWYIDDVTNALYLCESGVWQQVSGGGGAVVGANPTATGSNVAVNGAAATFMRSDAAPAIQLGSATLFGLAKADGITITAAGGVFSSVGGAASGNPSAVIGVTAVNGVAATFLRSDAAQALAAGSVFAGPRSLVYVLGNSNIQHSHTGDVAETLLFSVKIPANTLGANGGWRLTYIASNTGAGSVAITTRYGATNDVAGTSMNVFTMGVGAKNTGLNMFGAFNRNATNAQIGVRPIVGGTNALSPLVMAIDTTLDSYVVVSAQLTNAGDTVACEMFLLEFIPGGGN
jgi:hypothetical protein